MFRKWSISASAALLPLLLSSCFKITVTHSLKNGEITSGPGESYTDSPDEGFAVKAPATTTPGPVLQVWLKAESDNELEGMRYYIEQYNADTHAWDPIDGWFKLAATNVNGQVVWAKSVELSETSHGKPILLDLSRTTVNSPLRLTVLATERDGDTKAIAAKYFWGPTYDSHGP